MRRYVGLFCGLLVWMLVVGGGVAWAQVCDDGSLCTTNACQNGTCTVTQSVSCAPDSDQCTLEACNPDTGMCGSSPISCDDGNPCTNDSCDSATGCVHAAVSAGTMCDDGNPCTTDDACSADPPGPTPPTCTGTAAMAGTQCAPGNSCFGFTCQFGFCLPQQLINCTDDGNACTLEFCNPGQPSGQECQSFPITCNDLNECTSDSCNTTTGCVYNPVPHNAESCNDDNPCTDQDVCSNGDCNGQPVAVQSVTPSQAPSETPTIGVTVAPATTTATGTPSFGATNTPTVTPEVAPPTTTVTGTPSIGASNTPTVTPEVAPPTTTVTGTPSIGASNTPTVTPEVAPPTTTVTGTPSIGASSTPTVTAEVAPPTTTVTGTPSIEPSNTIAPTTIPTITPTTAMPPQLDVRPPVPHGFGTVNIGDSRTFTYIAENIGGGILTGTASTPCTAFSVAPPFPNLATSETVNLVVTFAPPGPGTYTCQLIIITNGGSETIDLSGTAVERPAIPIVPSPTSPAGIAMIALLAGAIGWALRRRAA